MSESTKDPKNKPAVGLGAQSKTIPAVSKSGDRPETEARNASAIIRQARMIESGTPFQATRKPAVKPATNTTNESTFTGPASISHAAPAQKSSKPSGSASPAAGGKVRPALTADATQTAGRLARSPSSKRKPAALTGAPRHAQLPSQSTIDRMVSEAAYYLAEKRNFAAGFEEQDWAAAREQIVAQLKGSKNPLG